MTPKSSPLTFPLLLLSALALSLLTACGPTDEAPELTPS